MTSPLPAAAPARHGQELSVKRFRENLLQFESDVSVAIANAGPPTASGGAP